jgi:RND family efflux transporter MFP subunit
MKYFLLTSIILSSFGIIGCEQNSQTQLILPEVETITLQSEDFAPEISLTGIIEAQKSIALASKISGRIQTLFFDIGGQVKKNEKVAQFSIIDDQSQIAYTNAINQLQTTKISTQSSIQSAEIAILNAQQQHEQAKRQEEANMKQLFDTLDARTNSSHALLERVLNFLDTTLGVSPQFQYGGNSSLVASVGSNDTIKKQNIKNSLTTILQRKKTTRFPFSQDALENARQEIVLLREMETITQNFYTLTRNTPITGNFSEMQRNTLKKTVEQFLSELSGDILTLESQARATETAKEQLGLGLIQTENEVQNAQAQLDMAQAGAQQQVQLAQSQIASTKNMQNELELRAPFKGIITQRFADEGALIAPGNPIFELADREKLKIYTDISDTQSGSITEGMKVDIAIDGLMEHFSGTITRINPAVNPSTRTLGIEITLDKSPQQIRLGMFARITVSLPTRKVFFIPNRYIQSQFSGTFVILQDGTMLPVELGEEKGGMREIRGETIQNGLQLRSTL